MPAPAPPLLLPLPDGSPCWGRAHGEERQLSPATLLATCHRSAPSRECRPPVPYRPHPSRNGHSPDNRLPCSEHTCGSRCTTGPCWLWLCPTSLPEPNQAFPLFASQWLASAERTANDVPPVDEWPEGSVGSSSADQPRGSVASSEPWFWLDGTACATPFRCEGPTSFFNQQKTQQEEDDAAPHKQEEQEDVTKIGRRPFADKCKQVDERQTSGQATHRLASACSQEVNAVGSHTILTGVPADKPTTDH